MTSPSNPAARSTWASSIHSSAVWVIPPWCAVCFGVRSRRRGNAALAWEIGFFEREKEKAPSSRRTPKFPPGYSPTTPAKARVQGLWAISAVYLQRRAGDPHTADRLSRPTSSPVHPPVAPEPQKVLDLSGHLLWQGPRAQRAAALLINVCGRLGPARLTGGDEKPENFSGLA